MKRKCPIGKIIKRDGSVVPYDRGRIQNAIAKALAATGHGGADLAVRLAGHVERALSAAYGTEVVPTVEDIQDVVESVLIEHKLVRVAKAYIIYRHEHAEMRARRAGKYDIADNVPFRKLYDALRWNVEHDCATVEGLNRIIEAGRFPELVANVDRRLENEIDTAVNQLLAGRRRIRVLVVAGPSSSGKTTVTFKIGERLAARGISRKTINVDNYFFELEKHPRDEFGDYDYEQPQAIDVSLLNRHLKELLGGGRVRIPRYDFKRGARIQEAEELELGANEILVLDSLHGLHESTTGCVPDEVKFRVYVEALSQFFASGTYLRWSDNRLMRRMVRDEHQRNLKSMQTLTHWHYVRRSELEHIIPFIAHADCVINTALPYELPVLKPRIFRCLAQAVRLYRSDARRLDAYIRASRIYDLLKRVRSIRSDSCIGGGSLLREFIGGGKYAY